MTVFEENRPLTQLLECATDKVRKVRFDEFIVRIWPCFETR